MKMLLVFASILVFSLVNCLPDRNLHADWMRYKNDYSKTYSQEEEAFRLLIFKGNKEMIDEHNEKYSKGLTKFTMKINKFADMSHEEFLETMTGYMGSESSSRTLKRRTNESTTMLPHPAHVIAIPQAVDWRKKGAVTPVKDQGQCGSCWAFSVTGSLEGQNYVKNGQLISLSEQNLIDCTEDYGNIGCTGGNFEPSFDYIIDNNGIDSEESYPYEEREGYCRYDSENIGARVSSYISLPKGDEKQLLVAVAEHGPVSIAIDASQPSFRFYYGGIYDEPRCSSIHLCHAVLVVGFDQEDGQDYWLIKNSWGTTWGEEGYMKMPRDEDNKCGVATNAVYPVMI